MNGRACFAVLVALSACDDGRWITRPNDVVVGTEREILAENSVVLAIDNVGTIGADGDGPFDGLGSFPAGSPDSYLFRAGIWIGGQYRGAPVVATAQDAFDGVSEFAPGRSGGSVEDGGRILCSDRPDDLAAWYPEFGDPATGTPLILGQKDCVVVFNDARQNQTFGARAPIGIEVRQRTAVFTEGLASQAVVFVWDIVHSGLFPLTDGHAAVFVYPSLGNDVDERCSVVLRERGETADPQGSRPHGDIAFCWDHDFETSEFVQERPGLQGVSFLRVPSEVPRPLTRFTIMHNPSLNRPQSDPVADEDQLAILRGTGTRRPYNDDIPSEVRFLAITGPVAFRRHEPRRVIAAFLWARAIGPVEELRVDASRCFPEGFPCFLADPDDPALAELIAVQRAVQQIVDERLPPP